MVTTDKFEEMLIVKDYANVVEKLAKEYNLFFLHCKKYLTKRQSSLRLNDGFGMAFIRRAQERNYSLISGKSCLKRILKKKICKFYKVKNGNL